MDEIAAMTASGQVHAELGRLERMWAIKQKMNALRRPAGESQLQTEEATAIRAHNAHRERELDQELEKVRALALRMEAGGSVVVTRTSHGWQARCEECGAMSPTRETAGGAGDYHHDCYSQSPPAVGDTRF